MSLKIGGIDRLHAGAEAPFIIRDNATLRV